MRVIPIIPVRGGKVTDISYKGRLIDGGDFHDLYLVMNQLNKVYDITYFMDLDAIFNGNQQLKLLKNLCEMNEVWVDPGVRGAEDIIDPLVAGGEWVSMGTSTLDSLDVVEEVVDFSDRVIPMIQWAGGKVLHRYPIKEKGMEDIKHHLDLFMDLGIEAVIFMDLERINKREGMDPDIIELLIGTGLDVYLAGGIKEQDVLTFTGLGAKGILLYINDLLEKISRMKPRKVAVQPHVVPEYEPAIQLNPLGFPEFSGSPMN